MMSKSEYSLACHAGTDSTRRGCLDSRSTLGKWALKMLRLSQESDQIKGYSIVW